MNVVKNKILRIIGFFFLWQVIILGILFIVPFIYFQYNSYIIYLGLTLIPFFVILSTSLLFYKKKSLSLQAVKYKYYLYPISLITIIPMSIVYTRGLHLEYIFYIAYSTSIIIVSSLLMLYILIGILLAFLSDRIIRGSQKVRFLKFVSLSLLLSAITTLAIKPAFKGICWLGNLHPESNVKEINSAKLKKTRFTPVLNEKITPGQNLIWCATYQLCWDKLVDFMKKPIKSSPPINAVQMLNQERFDPKWIDDSTYIALTSDKKIDFSKALEKKFGKENNSVLIKQMPKEAPSRIFFYSYLECSLPFKWKFQRSDYAMIFSDRERVESFGLRGYNISSRKEQDCIEQIVIKYCEEDEVVIELKTEKTDHHLILAMVEPKKTILETIEYVNSLIKKGSGYDYFFEPNAIIEIPVINFDLINKYEKLSNLKIGADKIIEESVQKIRFKLDESGAFVLSEAYISLGLGGGPISNLVFNKPFLIMLRYKDAKHPYFAAWIGNSELLMKTTKQTIREYYEAKREN